MRCCSLVAHGRSLHDRVMSSNIAGTHRGCRRHWLSKGLTVQILVTNSWLRRTKELGGSVPGTARGSAQCREGENV